MTTHAMTTVEELAQRYGDAWNAHDVDAILSMHTDDMVFQLHVAGYEEVAGEEGLRGMFGVFFDCWPDLEFRSKRLTVDERLFVNEMTMAGTLAQPMPLGARVVEPTGAAVEFDAVDVIPVEDGRVKRKDTYIDLAGLLGQHEPSSG